MKTVINLKNVDTTKQPMFLGEDLSIQRYDKFKYPKFYQNFQTQLSFFWRPEEVSLVKDRVDFKKLPDSQKAIFTKNLKYQILLDSCQARAIPLLSQYVTLPELEAAMISWPFFELIHSYSYTHIIKNVYSNPDEIFDTLLEDEEIIKRATSVTKYYNALIDAEEDLKKKLYLALINVNILEGIRFYVSFACAYAFAENKLMEGNSKVITLINRDENMHLVLTQQIITLLQKNKDEGFAEVAEECKPIAIQMFKDAVEEEMAWAQYLFKDGSMLGLNDTLLNQYMQWLTSKRMQAINLPPLFEQTKNPLGWISNWTDSTKLQPAPQETEIESYKVGSLKQNLDDNLFDGIDF
jgi:ribonucleoside-diphosphate reductase beta chain